MQLINIDKSTYRKHLNTVIISFIATLLILSLAFGSLLITAFGYSVVNEDVSNFRYNLLGVILALLACAAILHQLKHSQFFSEIYYVWRLKQLHNKIYRKIKKIKAAAEQDNVNALIILYFYCNSRKQVYLLDDNTLTLPSLEKEIQQIEMKSAKHNLSLSNEQFSEALINEF